MEPGDETGTMEPGRWNWGERYAAHVAAAQGINPRRTVTRGTFPDSSFMKQWLGQKSALGDEMIDRDGYRPNVGIVLTNVRCEVFWGKRVSEHSWQFPQGGIKAGEAPEQAMYRELMEEVGLSPSHVKILGRTRGWLRYDVPSHWIKRDWRGHYRGQKQIWYLLRLVGRDCDVCLRRSPKPEFDAWRWHDYWVPSEDVIEFKREVYQRALTELSRHLPDIRGRSPGYADVEPGISVEADGVSVECQTKS